jgi:NADH dehydrogenase
MGSAITAALRDGGHEVAILARSQPASPAPWVQADVTEPASLEGALTGADAVVDAVQFPNAPMENPRRGHTFEKVDLGGTRNLADAAAAQGVGHYVDLSGVGAAPDAAHHWFRFKWRAEQHIIASGVPYTIFRPSWAYGPHDVSLNRFLGFARFLPFVPVIGDGKARINPVFVSDVGTHVRAAIERGPANAIFEIGGPDVLTMDEIVQHALAAAGKRRFLLHAPAPLMKLAARVAQFAPGRPLTPGAVDFVTQSAVADTAALQERFGLPLTPFDEAVRSYL